MSHHEPGDMTLDRRDEWPSDVPIGTFDIEAGTIAGRPEVTAHMIFVCPRGQRCGVMLGPTFKDRPTPDTFCVWAWNGNVEQPTVTPSINCIAEKDGKPTGGCGWHGFITNGRMTP